jgi:predicted nuclease with TOPRIM domain
MSQVVLAERSADKTVVEKIHDVVSVDAVVFPATTSNLRESVEELAKPQAALESENEVEGLREELCALRQERDRLRERLDDLEREWQRREASAKIEKLVHDAQLPAFMVTDVLREQLLAAPDGGTRRALIAERQRVWREMVRSAPASRERRGREGELSDEAVVKAIRGGRPWSVVRGQL